MAEVNEHFLSVRDWKEAEKTLGFVPLRPKNRPRALRIHVKDHRMRNVPPTLEVHFDGYVLSQAKRHPAEASRLAAESYGPDPRVVSVAGQHAHAYDLGPEPADDDTDPRPPAVVTWADGPLFLLLASETKTVADLLGIAASLYE